MKLLINSLRKTPIFARLSAAQIQILIQHTEIYAVTAGTKITAPENAVKHHLLILDGNFKSDNKWLFHGNEMQYCWQLLSDESLSRTAILSSATRAIKATATAETRYMFIDGDDVEALEEANKEATRPISIQSNIHSTELLKLSA